MRPPQKSTRSRNNTDTSHATEYRRFEKELYQLTKQTMQLSHDSSTNNLNHILQQNELKSPSSHRGYSKSISHQSLPSVMSTSSLSSVASTTSNYSTPSVTSPPIIHTNLLKRNHSLSTLHYQLSTKHRPTGCFVPATTFSAPISPKYDAHTKLPSIHKRITHRAHSTVSDNKLPSYALDCKIKKPKKKFRSKHVHKSKYKKKMKRNQSMPALYLDLSTLSIDENSNALHSHHVQTNTKNPIYNDIKMPQSAHPSNISLNAIKSNILLQFDLAPKSIDERSLYEITEHGAFKLNQFVVSFTGLDIGTKAYSATSSNFVEVSILGRGSSSVVYKSWDLKNKRFIALKCISVFEQHKRKQILNELELLTDNDCDPIVEFYGAYFYSGQVIFCLEYFDIGSLQELIEINGAIPLQFISYIMHYILKAVVYLHTKSIIYRDIKPSNVLIHSNGNIKLSDFGIFHQCDDAVFCNEVIGTTIYMSPQRLNGKPYSYLSDIWSVGLCVAQAIYPQFSLFTNYDESTMLIQKYILNTTASIHEFFPKEIIMNEEVRDFMNKCLLKEESVRWSAKQLLNHSFISKYNMVKGHDFKAYVSSSNMYDVQHDKYKHELVSMKSSLLELFLKNKITRSDMEIPILQMQTILDCD